MCDGVYHVMDDGTSLQAGLDATEPATIPSKQVKLAYNRMPYMGRLAVRRSA